MHHYLLSVLKKKNCIENLLGILKKKKHFLNRVPANKTSSPRLKNVFVSLTDTIYICSTTPLIKKKPFSLII